MMDTQIPVPTTQSSAIPPSKLSLIVGAILLLFVAVGGAYYLGTLKKNSQGLPKLSSIDTQQTTTDEFIISELGIEFPLASITDFDYVIRSGVGDRGEYKIADFSTKTLESTGGKYCGAEGAPIGSVEVLSSPLTQAGRYGTQIGNKYVYYTHPQATCSDDKSVQELTQKAISELQQQLKLAELTQREETTGNWIQYTAPKGSGFNEFSISYPPSWTKELKMIEGIGYNLLFTKQAHTVRIYQAAFGGAACIFDGDEMPDGPAADYRGKSFVPISSYTSLRRVGTAGNAKSQSVYVICGRSKESDRYMNPLTIGSITYEVPLTPDQTLLKEMDSILSTINLE